MTVELCPSLLSILWAYSVPLKIYGILAPQETLDLRFFSSSKCCLNLNPLDPFLNPVLCGFCAPAQIDLLCFLSLTFMLQVYFGRFKSQPFRGIYLM